MKSEKGAATDKPATKHDLSNLSKTKNTIP